MGDRGHGATGTLSAARRLRPKAVVLAGGPGTLRCPLANAYPRLLFPMIDGQPLAHHIIGFLKTSGVTEIAFSLSAQVRQLEKVQQILSSISDPTLRVHWQVDRGSRGAAGALKDLSWFLGDAPATVLFSSLWPEDLDLGKIWRAHRDSGAAMTVILESRARDRRDLENVDLDSQGLIGRISTLHESRDNRRQLYPAGIYLLESRTLDVIDFEGYVDLKEQFIPELQRHGYRARGDVLPAPLSKIETLSDYMAINRRLLLERARERSSVGDFDRDQGSAIIMGKDVKVAPTALIIGPATIGDRCEIGDGAKIIGPVIVGDDTCVGPRALLRESIVWTECRLGEGASLEYSLMTDSCTLPAGASVAGALVEQGRVLADGINLVNSDSAPILVSGAASPTRTPGYRKVTRVAYMAVKRALDLLLPIATLPVLAPLGAIVVIAIKVDTPGPVFYSQPRCGRGGREFQMYKFRTMVLDAHSQQSTLHEKKEADGPMFKMKHDPRITRVGRFLRRTSLDELPQLWNVARGEMSLVGPRPLAMHEMIWCPRWRDIRLKVKPGLTGLWQVSGRSDLGFDGWIENDISYVRDQSLWLDLRIMLKTFKVLLGRSGAI